MKKFFKPIVLAILAGSLAVVSCTQDNRAEIDGIKAEIAAIKEKMAAGEVDVKAQISTLQYLLQAYKEEVNPKLTALDAQMKVDYTVLSEADEALAKALKDAETALLAKINKNSSDIAATNEEVQKAIAEYKKLVADAIAEFEAAIEKVKADQAIVDGVQNLALEALSTQISAYKATIDEAVAKLEETVIAIGVAVETVAGEVEEIGETLEELQEEMEESYAECMAYTDALEAAVDATIEALEERIAANEAAIEELTTEVIPEIEDAIEALEAAIEGLEGNVEALDGKKLDKTTFNAFLTQFNTWKAQTETRLDNVEGALALFEIFQGVITKQVATLTNLVTVLNGDENVPESVKNQIEALHALIIKDLEAMKTNLEAEIGKLNSDLEGVKADVAEAQSDITVLYGMIEDVNGEIANINEAIKTAQGDIETAQGDIEALKKVKGELEDELKALEETLDEKIAALAVLLGDVKADVVKILGDKTVVGSIAYYVDQLSTSIQGLDTRITDNANAIAALNDEIAKLTKRIQSLVFVPQYTDLKFGIPFSGISDGSGSDINKAYNDPDNGFTVVYKVAPADLAKHLAKAVNDAIALKADPIFTFDIESGLKTRATATEPKLTIMKAEVNEENVDETGKITFHLSHEGFEPTAGKLDNYAVSLRVDNDQFGVHVASEYVQTVLQPAGITIKIDKNNIYKVNTAGTLDVIDVDTTLSPDDSLDIAYTDGIAYAILAGYELGAELFDGGISQGTFTYSQLKAMGYDMPDQVTTATFSSGNECDIVSDLSKGAASTFNVKIVDGAEDNMKNTKNQIGKYKIFNYAFNDGLGTAAENTVNAQVKVRIAKHAGNIKLNIPIEMNWTYALDAKVDSLNKAGTWKKNYLRDSIEVKPTLTITEGVSELDGSNKVFGLEVSDFAGKHFTSSGTVDNIIADFDIDGYSTEKNTLALDTLQVKKRLGDSYTVTGTYDLGSYFTSPVSATVSVKTKDRLTADINIAVPSYEATLLGDGWHINTGDGYYSMKSVDLADVLMTAYVNQGIFSSTTTKAEAFSSEFKQSNIKCIYDGTKGKDESFKAVIDATSFVLTENGELLTSNVLHTIASNYDNDPWSLTVETYVGQKVTFTWPISAHPNNTYKFNTVGLNTSDNSFSIPASLVWQGGTTSIEKAKTELDLIKDTKIQVMTGTGGSGTINFENYDDNDKKLVPEFKLVNPSTGVTIEATDPRFLSNVRYYGQAPSVAVKSALYIVSGTTRFLVPDSDKMYVNNTSNTVNAINVKQFNPIADPVVTTGSTSMGKTDTQTIPISMEDILGNGFYVNGAKTKASNYDPDVNIKVEDIFGDITFKVFTVNGSDTTTGWSIANPTSPLSVQLHTENVAAGTYQVVVKATTQWKTYLYTITVTVS